MVGADGVYGILETNNKIWIYFVQRALFDGPTDWKVGVFLFCGE
jgi:hypothetical protein